MARIIVVGVQRGAIIGKVDEEAAVGAVADARTAEVPGTMPMDGGVTVVEDITAAEDTALDDTTDKDCSL